jgi:hypothetical protein
VIRHTTLPDERPACHVPDCGHIFCTTCGERMTCTGPKPLPRCAEHPTCTSCDGPVYCTECALAIAVVAQDRAVDLAYDVQREA